MPRPHAAIPDFLPPLHLYRHLLRECSYLPPVFSPTITSIIRNRFRNHRRNDSMKKKHRAKASSALRTLRAANNGDKPSMEKLIYHGFGRTGFRRRSLVTDFVRAQGPNDSDALEALIDGDALKSSPDSAAAGASKAVPGQGSPSKNPNATASKAPEGNVEAKPHPGRRNNKPIHIRNDFYEKWDLVKTRELLASQRDLQRNSSIGWLKRKLKSLNPNGNVPETNLWGKPPAENVVRAKKARFWRGAVNKLMVPLSNGEWELLGQLSQGAQEQGDWAIPARRPAASPTQAPKQETPSSWNWQAFASRPVARIEHRATKNAFVGRGGKDEEPYQTQLKTSDISPRWFRRAYRRTWQYTPKMEQDARSLKHTITWGPVKKATVRATDAQLAVFEGVDGQGKTPKPSSRTPTADPARAGDRLARTHPRSMPHT